MARTAPRRVTRTRILTVLPAGTANRALPIVLCPATRRRVPRRGPTGQRAFTRATPRRATIRWRFRTRPANATRGDTGGVPSGDGDGEGVGSGCPALGLDGGVGGAPGSTGAGAAAGGS